MTQYTITEARASGVAAGARSYGGAREVLRKSAGATGSFDIFLSHSFTDAELILGVREILQRSGKSVYVDWIDDPQLDRTRVTKNSALQLRQRMNQCSSLVYAATQAATASKWMPWELGYFDGHRSPEAVAIMPLVAYPGQTVGQEYLEIYPTIEKPKELFGAPVVTKKSGYNTLQKSLSDLAAGRGGPAWRTVY